MLHIITEQGLKTSRGGTRAQKRSLKQYLLEKLQTWINSLLEPKRDKFLGRDRHERLDQARENYRNGYHPSKLNLLSLGRLWLKVPRDRKGEFQSAWLPERKGQAAGSFPGGGRFGNVISRRWLRRARYLTSGLLVVLLLLAGAGAVYQGMTSANERRLYPPPGKLVDVGGHQLHICCIGEGSPTVVLEAGLKHSSFRWYRVQPEVAKFARVCAYDRAGYGWSQPGPKPRTSKVIAEELHTLLHNGGISGPYILVGHSFGGFAARMYASQYPGEAAGIVLVDSPQPDAEQPSRLIPLSKGHPRALIELMAMSAPLGLPRLLEWCGNAPPPIRAMARAVECGSQFFNTMREEFLSFDESASQVQRAGSLGDLPLVVVSGDYGNIAARLPAGEPEKAWEEMQEELVHLSSRGMRMVAEKGGHDIPNERPDAVVEAIRKVVEMTRKQM